MEEVFRVLLFLIGFAYVMLTFVGEISGLLLWDRVKLLERELGRIDRGDCLRKCNPPDLRTAADLGPPKIFTGDEPGIEGFR